MKRTQFPQNEIITNAVAKLMIAYGDLPRGSIVKHHDIQGTSGIAYMSLHWPGMISRWRRVMLTEKNIELIGERGEGIAFATETRQINEMSERRQRSALRQFGRAIRSCRAIQDSELSPILRKAKMVRLQYLDAMKQSAKEALDGQEKACYATPTQPARRPIPKQSIAAMATAN